MKEIPNRPGEYIHRRDPVVNNLPIFEYRHHSFFKPQEHKIAIFNKIDSAAIAPDSPAPDEHTL